MSIYSLAVPERDFIDFHPYTQTHLTITNAFAGAKCYTERPCLQVPIYNVLGSYYYMPVHISFHWIHCLCYL